MPASGLLAALAIALHNLPEGLATFLGALADPAAGVAIAVAVALHNIPEGIVVAMPIYYATGSRWKAFMWATISGLSEPLGGLLVSSTSSTVVTLHSRRAHALLAPVGTVAPYLLGLITWFATLATHNIIVSIL